MITIKISDPIESGAGRNYSCYEYNIIEDGTEVLAGMIEDVARSAHPIKILQQVCEDSIGKLHQNRNGR